MSRNRAEPLGGAATSLFHALRKHMPLTQCCFSNGSPSAMLSHHENIDYTSRVCCALIVKTVNLGCSGRDAEHV